MPLLLKTIVGNLDVEISSEDLKRLKTYRGKSMLLLPNHPTYLDPYVLFELSKRLNENFNYVCARELFDLSNGLWGVTLQHLGAYSIIRGASDRESFKTSREILANGNNRLVIFIEGEVSHENDTLIPFESGVIQLAFWGLEDRMRRAKAEQKDFSAEDGIYLAPVAVKYLCKDGCEVHIERAVSHLEKAVGLNHPTEKKTYQRIIAIGQTVLETQEKRLNIQPQEDASITGRIEILKDRLLTKMELFLDLTPTANTSILDRVRGIRNRMDKMIYTYQEPPSLSPYEERVLEQERQELHEFYQELERVVNLLVLREGYIEENETPERYIDVIRRLEREVFGKPLINPPRTAVIRIGDILNLHTTYPAYEENKKKTVQQIASNMEQEMTTLLHGIHSRHPLQPPV